MELTTRNTNQLSKEFYPTIRKRGVVKHSPKGQVIQMSEPCLFHLTQPRERVNFSADRDANPFFHLFEAMAMLGDFNDAEFHAHFAKNMLSFSDDGKRFNAYYGERMRSSFGFDQLSGVIRLLAKDPTSRQAVINLWSTADFDRPTKDKACNLMILFSVENGKLNMTTTNRSNDMIWGFVSGANIVHFSFFQEYVACALQVEVGRWSHFTNNAHVYIDNPKMYKLLRETVFTDPYALGEVHCGQPLFTNQSTELFDTALGTLLRTMKTAIEANRIYLPANPYVEAVPFLRDTVAPAFEAWQHRKVKKDFESAYRCLDTVEQSSPDWAVAMRGWLKRRENN